MSEDESWRSEAAYEYIDRLSPEELAWEFLRRNVDYMTAYQGLLSDGEMNGEAARDFASKWGLRFCRRSYAVSIGSAHFLDGAGRSCGHRPTPPTHS